MPSPSPRLVSNALRLTAAVNALAGSAALALPDLHARLMLAPGAALDGLTLRYHVIVWLFVLAMAPAYAVASRDPERQTGLLLCGGLGKLGVAAVWTEMLVSGHGAWLMLGGVAFDGLFGLLFLAFVLPRIGGGR